MQYSLSMSMVDGEPFQMRFKECLRASFMRCYDFPEQLGWGTVKQIPIQQGVDLSIVKVMIHKPLETHIVFNDSAFELGFCLSGDGDVDIPGASIQSGLFNMLYRQSRELNVLDRAGSYRLCVALVVAPDTFHDLSRHEPGRLPPHLHLMAGGMMGGDYAAALPITKVYSGILHQILTPPRGLEHSHMHYKAKTYELLSQCITQLKGGESCQDMNKEEYSAERVHQAAEILIHSMEDPPTLDSLSRMLATSHVTLNQEFRLAFGTTVFGYLRRLRLDRARHILETSDANVTEASLAVGYNSISTFSHAFRERHGMMPSACRKG